MRESEREREREREREKLMGSERDTHSKVKMLAFNITTHNQEYIP
jgi:hypothetical protein